METQDERLSAATILTWLKRITPNFPALLTLCAVVLIWKALSPIWVPCLAWLFSLIGPGLSQLGEALFFTFVGLASISMIGLVLAVVSLLLGGGLIRSR